jgi:hypothetical protein
MGTRATHTPVLLFWDGSALEEEIVLGTATPAEAGLPGGHSAATLRGTASIPVSGIPVLVLHGPVAIRAALGIAPDQLLVRPLAPLVPSIHIHRREVVDIEIRDGHWYALGRRTVCIRRAKGQGVRLMAPAVPGVPDGTDNLGRLLRAWWRSDAGRRAL